VLMGYIFVCLAQNNELLMQHLADAIGQCCKFGQNREKFGEANAVVPLVRYLSCKNTDVQQATAKALHELSKHPENCIDMHKRGCIKVEVVVIVVVVICIAPSFKDSIQILRRFFRHTRRQFLTQKRGHSKHNRLYI